jgi:hypothetical protein
MRVQFPELMHISVTLPVFGHQPIFLLEPALPALLLKTADNRLYLIDTSGRALIGSSQVRGLDRLDLVVVEDQSGLPVGLGSTVLPSTNVDFIREVVNQFRAKKLVIASLALPKATSELDVRLEGTAYTIKFNLRGDARAEVGTYLAVKRQLESQQKVPNTYIDVRVDNRAYYR